MRADLNIFFQREAAVCCITSYFWGIQQSSLGLLAYLYRSTEKLAGGNIRSSDTAYA